MAKRDEILFLEEVYESIDLIEKYVSGLTEKEFEENTEKQDAVLRRIEIIGEAVKNLSQKTRSQYPDLPWKEMAGMRDVVIHQYFGVTIGMVWRVATSDLILLRDRIKDIIDDLK
ncbi:MAG: DUF86 domain-containing protein [Saprospiraceae bacterium]|nr:DUF86 domain-containing protein [Saprospiraceae bacterium]